MDMDKIKTKIAPTAVPRTGEPKIAKQNNPSRPRPSPVEAPKAKKSRNWKTKPEAT
jgi:hypothetical protein